MTEKGRIVSWNPGARNVFGYASEEIIGQHFSRFYSTEDQANGLPTRILREATTTGRFEGEGWRYGKGGRRFRAGVIIDAIRDPDGKLLGFANITRDVTETHEAQQALRESERQFRLLVEGVVDYAIYMLDPNGVIVSWNAGAQRLKGYTPSEILGRNFERFYTGEDRAAGVPRQVLQAAAREGQFEAEGLACAQRRQPLLGLRRHRCDP